MSGRGIKTKGRFTKEEDDTLLNIISNFPLNIQFALKEASTIMNRTPGSLQLRYYRTLRKNSDNKTISCGSKHGFSRNTKNLFRNQDGSLPNQELQCIEIIISHYSMLSFEQKKNVIEILINN